MNNYGKNGRKNTFPASTRVAKNLAFLVEKKCNLTTQ